MNLGLRCSRCACPGSTMYLDMDTIGNRIVIIREHPHNRLLLRLAAVSGCRIVRQRAPCATQHPDIMVRCCCAQTMVVAVFYCLWRYRRQQWPPMLHLPAHLRQNVSPEIRQPGDQMTISSAFILELRIPSSRFLIIFSRI